MTELQLLDLARERAELQKKYRLSDKSEGNIRIGNRIKEINEILKENGYVQDVKTRKNRARSRITWK